MTALFGRRVLLRPLGSVLYAMPPLATTRPSLERIAIAMIRAVQLVQAAG